MGCVCDELFSGITLTHTNSQGSINRVVSSQGSSWSEVGSVEFSGASSFFGQFMSRLCSLCFDLQTQLLRPHRLTNVLNTEYHRKCLDTLQKSLARQHLYYILKWFVGRIVSTGAPSFSLSTFQEIHMLHGWSKKWSLGQSNSPQSITRHNWEKLVQNWI